MFWYFSLLRSHFPPNRRRLYRRGKEKEEERRRPKTESAKPSKKGGCKQFIYFSLVGLRKKAFKINSNTQPTGRKTLTKMAIQLDKILADIAKEKALHPNNGGSSKQEQEEAWARIGRLNKLSVHETRSIFIVLQKKYEQEKLKGNSAWKLFGLMHQIHQEPKTVIKEEK